MTHIHSPEPNVMLFWVAWHLEPVPCFLMWQYAKVLCPAVSDKQVLVTPLHGSVQTVHKDSFCNNVTDVENSRRYFEEPFRNGQVADAISMKSKSNELKYVTLGWYWSFTPYTSKS